MSEWQPIETLTEEIGDVLLLWTYQESNNADIRIGRLKWVFRGVPFVKCSLDFGDFDAGCFSSEDSPPTHWMPLPEPPK